MAKKTAIKDIKHRIIDYSILFGGCAGLLITIIQNILAKEHNPDIRLLIDIVAISTLWIVWYFRHKVSLVLKSLIVITAVFLLWAQGIFHVGFHSHNTMLFILLPLFLTLAINYRLNLLLTILFVAFYIGIAYAFTSDTLRINVDLSERVNSISHWIIHLLILAILSFVIIIILDSYKNYFKKLITKLEKQNLELNKHQKHLNELVEERTNKLNQAYEALSTTNNELEQKNKLINDQNNELKNTLIYLKNTQAKLIESEKMASLGTLTAGVAHEINNPLNYIMGAHVGLSNYFEKYGSNEQDNTDVFLNSIHTGIERVTNIVSGLNQFNRTNSSFNEVCDIHSIIDNCLVMLHNQLKHKIEVIKTYHSETPHIKGNIGKLHQAIFNILNNSIQAINNNGKITIWTSLNPNNIVLKITDNGCGIKAEHLTKVTDPFFTTKPPGKGTGLGLSICYSIIQSHNGTLEITSEPNIETQVIVQLPKENDNE
ncbi:ATP-binding protein [Carboxylicivirga sp. N1Y90]|uniref:ATP-binding protein n=1 Tax=Carboxylicivirga fragile TaxID=3417571 RepID=UPI003D33984F|nr:hypothetical protein [Marinilabiliaceae bacterium N1Y90]